jgi:hypothetical protein
MVEEEKKTKKIENNYYSSLFVDVQISQIRIAHSFAEVWFALS